MSIQAQVILTANTKTRYSILQVSHFNTVYAFYCDYCPFIFDAVFSAEDHSIWTTPWTGHQFITEERAVAVCQSAL